MRYCSYPETLQESWSDHIRKTTFIADSLVDLKHLYNVKVEQVSEQPSNTTAFPSNKLLPDPIKLELSTSATLDNCSISTGLLPANQTIVDNSTVRKRKASPLFLTTALENTNNNNGQQIVDSITVDTIAANKLPRVVTNSNIHNQTNSEAVEYIALNQQQGIQAANHLTTATTAGLGGLIVARLPSAQHPSQQTALSSPGGSALLPPAAVGANTLLRQSSAIGPQVFSAAAAANLLAVQQQLQQPAQQAQAAYILANPLAATTTSFATAESQQLQTPSIATASHTFINSAGKPTNMSVQQRDTTYTKIFVGGLPYHTTDASLRDYFAVFGDIDEAVVITDRQTGKSRGYGFVTMSDRVAAERACKDANPVIDGRKANVNLAYIGAKPRTVQTTIGLRSIPQSYFSPNQLTGTVPAVYAQYPQTPAAYVTNGGVLIQAHTAQHASPLLDYAGMYATQFPGAYTTDVAAATGAAPFANAYAAAPLHHPATALAATTVAGAAQILAAAPAQTGIPVSATYQGIAGYHPATPASVAAAYAAAVNPLSQPPPLAGTPTQVAHLAAHMQQQAAERY